MMKYIFIDFSKNFCNETTVIYREDTNSKTETCKNNIIIFFKELLQNLQQKFNIEIFHIDSKEKIIDFFETAETFLFYSAENALEYQELLCTSFENKLDINSIDDIYLHDSNSLVISNDWDGDGLYFYINPDSDIYLWFLENLNLKIVEISKHS